jgi:hypothetical protein
MVLEKRKFHAKSGTKRSLFRLRLRLLHAMLNIVLIVCLVVFVVLPPSRCIGPARISRSSF